MKYAIVYDDRNNSYRVRRRMKLWFFYVWYTVDFFSTYEEAEVMFKYLTK